MRHLFTHWSAIRGAFDLIEVDDELRTVTTLRGATDEDLARIPSLVHLKQWPDKSGREFIAEVCGL